MSRELKKSPDGRSLSARSFHEVLGRGEFPRENWTFDDSWPYVLPPGGCFLCELRSLASDVALEPGDGVDGESFGLEYIILSDGAELVLKTGMER